MKPLGFGKAQRLKSRKEIDALFAAGKAVHQPPLRMVYRVLPAAAGETKAGVGAPKKFFKHAVDRNRLKRLLREAYRLQKGELANEAASAGKTLRLFFLYTSREMSDFETLQKAMAACLQKIRKQL